MKSLIGVYASQVEAVKAVESLKSAGYAPKQISLITKADIIDNHIHVKSSNTAEKAEMSIGTTAGAVIGVLTGVGVFAIPGLGFLFGAGAIVGLIAGLDFGIIGSGVAAILTSMGVDEVNWVKYERHLNEGKFLVFIQGNESEVEKAAKVLHTLGSHLELD
jgi:hypothetical protein